MKILRTFSVACSALAAFGLAVASQSPTALEDSELLVTPYPILFVTQVPVPADFTTVGSTFGNHLGDVQSAARGGDLYIRYPNGALRNLTEEAGYGSDGFQDENSIAVRDPHVHWSGDKALFSMVIGSHTEQYVWDSYYWQLYEIEGLGTHDTPVITKVANQPGGANNTAPCYASDDRVLFTSDRPFNGAAHLVPQLDEYEEAPSVTGLWRLDPADGRLELLTHTPSGAFDPSVDSFGRVVFTRWDHLVRDQQADSAYMGGFDYGTFNYSDESASAVPTASDEELFPEPRGQWINFVNNNPQYNGPVRGWERRLQGSAVNHFFPWMIHQDGTGEETLIHSGRHELHAYFDRSFNNDPNLEEFLGPGPNTANQNTIDQVLQLREDPLNPGAFFAIDAPEFYTHACGQVLRIFAPPGVSPDQMTLDYITHRDTHTYDSTPSDDHSGLYRNPLPLRDGQWLVVHTPETRRDENDGSREFPRSRYDLRIKALVPDGAHWSALPTLTGGIHKSVTYYDPDVLVTYSGELWELDPVEVVASPAPPAPTSMLEAPEQQILDEEDVALRDLKAFLVANQLALAVSRDVTTRDRNDRQQPFNLRVDGTSHETVAEPGRVYEARYLQLFQADMLRGLTFGGSQPVAGRRVLAQPMHDLSVSNPPLPTAPDGSVQIAADGSLAALVPARRAMTWQLTESDGDPIVRERYWITFQPGEVRMCTSCHGMSSADQLGRPAPQNPPEALRQLLQYLKGTGEL